MNVAGDFSKRIPGRPLLPKPPRTLNEIIAEMSAERAASRGDGVSSLGGRSIETEARLSPLRGDFHYLTNPTGEAAGTVVGFLLFFSTMYHGMAGLMLIGPLRVTRV